MYHGHTNTPGSSYAGMHHDDDDNAGYQGGAHPGQLYHNDDEEGHGLYNKGSETDLYNKFKRDEMTKNDEKASEFDELVEETAKKVADHSPGMNKTPEFASEMTPEMQDAAARHFLAQELQKKKAEEELNLENSSHEQEPESKPEKSVKLKKNDANDTIEDHIFEAIQNAKSS